MTATSTLTGAGAGVAIAPGPAAGAPSPERLHLRRDRPRDPAVHRRRGRLPARLEDRHGPDRHPVGDRPPAGRLRLPRHAERQSLRLDSRPVPRRRRPGLGHRPQAAGRSSRAIRRPASSPRPSPKPRSCPSKTSSSNSSRAPGRRLKTGIACGTYTVHSDLTPWTAPEGSVAHPEDSFEIERGAAAGDCVKDEASAPNAPKFEAGTFEPSAGLYSPFTLRLSRGDGSQRLSGVDATLPEGLLARLAGVPYCSDAALAKAASSTGRAELASPSCPAASRVGSVQVAAGAGPAPFHVSGSVYLDRPVQGRSAQPGRRHPGGRRSLRPRRRGRPQRPLHDPETTQVRAVSDPDPLDPQGDPARPALGGRQPRPRPVHQEPDLLQPAGDHRLAHVPGRPGHRLQPALPGRRLQPPPLQTEPLPQPQGRHQAHRPPGAEGSAQRSGSRLEHQPGHRSRCRARSSSTTPTSGRSAPGSSSPRTPAPRARSTAAPRRLRPCSTRRSRARSTCAAPPTRYPTSSPTCMASSTSSSTGASTAPRAEACGPPSKASPTPPSPASSSR